jgi:hypothetical protein
MNGHRPTRFAMLAWLAAAVAASGQARRQGQHALGAVRRLECSFSLVAAGEWQNGRADVRVTADRVPLRLTITDIDSVNGSATIRRAEGASSASVQLSGSNLYFLDVHGRGPALTTVFSQENTPGRLKAVHVETTPTPAQFDGDCEILDERGT